MCSLHNFVLSITQLVSNQCREPVTSGQFKRSSHGTLLLTQPSPAEFSSLKLNIMKLLYFWTTICFNGGTFTKLSNIETEIVGSRCLVCKVLKRHCFDTLTTDSNYEHVFNILQKRRFDFINVSLPIFLLFAHSFFFQFLSRLQKSRLMPSRLN